MPTRLYIAGAAALILLALISAFIGQPSAARKADHWKPELDAIIDSRDIHIDPGELGAMMHDRKTNLIMLDVRDERDFNLFHLVDVQRISVDDLSAGFVRDLPEQAVVVVMGNGEKPAEECWRLLRAQSIENAYILAGGLNGWLDVFLPKPAGDIAAKIRDGANKSDTLLHTFDSALGSAHPTAHPSLETVERREYEKKVELKETGPKVQGGCG